MISYRFQSPSSFHKKVETKGSVNYYTSLIIYESFFCINRSYLLTDRKTKLFCKIVTFITAVVITCVVIYDFFISSVKLHPVLICLEIALISQLAYFHVEGRNDQRSFDAIARLDSIHPLDEVTAASIKQISRFTTVLWIISAILNIFASQAFVFGWSVKILFIIMTIVFDSEVELLWILIKVFNMRLEKLKEATHVEGPKILRHLLLAATQVREDFSFRLAMILTVLVVKTILYAGYLLFMEVETVPLILVVWREFRTLSSLCMFCLTAGNSKAICKRLALNLTKRLIDPKLRLSPKSRTILARWRAGVQRVAPKYTSAAVIVMDLNVPLDLLDVSVNYVLIAVQFYAANK